MTKPDDPHPDLDRTPDEVAFEDKVAALSEPRAYPGHVDTVERRETHLSLLFFTEDRVYKLKKPVRLEFVDYTDVESRRRFCEEEVRLNRRVSPSMYLGVRPVTAGRSPAHGVASIDGEGPVVDWVVEMVRLPEERMLERLLERGDLDEKAIDAVALVLARFHSRAMTGPGVNRHGLLASLVERHATNLRELSEVSERSRRPLPREYLDFVDQRDRTIFAKRRDLFERRLADWRIREGHGDLHAGNICLREGEVLVYDCVEFDRALRCADVASDLAFLCMDLRHRGHRGTAQRLVERYAQIASDGDLELLTGFYAPYRAVVRSKVALLTAEVDSLGAEAQRAAQLEAQSYAQLAVAYGLPTSLVLLCGLPGTGKSTTARYLAGRLGASLLRSDVVRRKGPEPAGRYSLEARTKVYDELLARAQADLEAGRTVVVDATFSRTAFRRPFLELAERHDLPLVVVHVRVPDEVARARLAARKARPNEPSEADAAAYRAEEEAFEAATEVPDARILEASGEAPPEEQAEPVFVRLIDDSLEGQTFARPMP